MEGRAFEDRKTDRVFENDSKEHVVVFSQLQKILVSWKACMHFAKQEVLYGLAF